MHFTFFRATRRVVRPVAVAAWRDLVCLGLRLPGPRAASSCGTTPKTAAALARPVNTSRMHSFLCEVPQRLTSWLLLAGRNTVSAGR